MKLALGTAQFGLPYGIANQTGQVSRSGAAEILAYAIKNGVDTLDTAIAYGDSEACIGASQINGFRIVTKLPSCPEGVEDVSFWVKNQLQNSLSRLRVESVYALLLHRPQDFLGSHGNVLANTLLHLRAEGFIHKIGISIYSPKELEDIFGIFPIDIVQAPFNLIDRRLHTSGWLERLHHSGVEIHTRSVFLQGLLLLPKKIQKLKFSPWSSLWDHWSEWLNENEASEVEACLQFPLSFPEVDRIIVGIDSIVQLKYLLEALSGFERRSLPDLSCNDELLINPSNWKMIKEKK